MNRRQFLQAAGTLAAASLLPAAETRPNILFILADDLGIDGLGCYGADNYKTPNIDRLAEGGIRFTHCYTAPLCGPSRALIQTGRYAFRTGATNQDATGLMKPSAETMWPGYFKPAGYATASIGKWGQLPLSPAEFGYEEYVTFQGSGVYWNTQEKGKTYTLNGAKTPLRDGEYMPDLLHRYLVGFLERHRDKPFLAYYPMSHVHAEILPTPDSPKDSKSLYADNIAYMDKLVGKIVAELERLKLRENTLVIFVGDNGTGGGYAAQSTIGGRRLSGEKGSMLEGGALVPLIVNWPGRTPAGQVNGEMIDSTDFLPTLADIAGMGLPKDKVLDGRSFAPQIYGKAGQSKPAIYVQLANQYYAREPRWKLNQSGELFDMSGAPFEEPLVRRDTTNPDAVGARKRLQSLIDSLDPAHGIVDGGDGTGRHANREENRKKKAAKKSTPKP